ncbi:carboxymuconolactone decarboxylase family protein [Stigmatella hybrida]|uniref:carboxymuconolactone decarboxylase family protein n=1 Tax=Stigmatella hybrida TaxID=394097 RepID=UPI001CDA585A|nr:carboxymuconolactone decarboxylase family protein [Stigmatella hybrida]
MSNVPLLDADRATPEVISIYQAFQTGMGFPAPPDFIKVLGHSYAAAAGTLEIVKHVLLQGVLPRTVKEMLFVAVSHARGCKYCEAAHLACCRSLGIDESTLDLLVSNVSDIMPVKTRRLLEFGVRCAMNPQALTEADYETLRGQGFSQAELVETVSMAGLAVYLNTMAEALKVPPDKMFEKA